VQKGNINKMLALMVLMSQIAATVGLGLFAGITESSTFVLPAIACAGYTVASVNNAFDKDLYGMVAFLDSPVMILMIMVILISTLFSAPVGFQSLIGLAICCLPFLVDFFLSVGYTYRRVTTGEVDSVRQGGATVTELTEANEESFLAVDNQSDSRDHTPGMINPSDMLIPAHMGQN